MNHLLRELAPLTDEAWAALDDEARARLQPVLGARSLVDVVGPLGWSHSASDLGRLTGASDQPGLTVRPRAVLPLVEVRADATIRRSELDDIARGAIDVDLSALDAAAHRLAEFENAAIVDGAEATGAGIVGMSSHPAIALPTDSAQIVETVSAAVEVLGSAGVGGPYAAAVDTSTWVAVLGGSDRGGQPLRRHVEKVLGGPVVWTPGVHGIVVLSRRGGDFVLELGEDISLGYDSHDRDNVTIYLEESFSFRVATPEAAIVIR